MWPAAAKAVSSLPSLPMAQGGPEVPVEGSWIEAAAAHVRGVHACEPLWRLPGDTVMQPNSVAAVWTPEDHSAVVVALCPALHSGVMAELTAIVSSGLRPFSEVTLQALGQDKATGESGLRGKLVQGINWLASLTCGPQLEVMNTLTGERGSAYRFQSVNGEPANIVAIKEFWWQQKKGLLVGLEGSEGSILCLYDISTSKVVKAVAISGRVTAIEPLSHQGGPSAVTENLHSSLQGLFGVAAVATDVGQILLIDLSLEDLPYKQTGINASLPQAMIHILDEVQHLRERARQKGQHLGFELLGSSGTAISTLLYINRTNQLAVGYADGYLALWSMKSMSEDCYLQLKGGTTPISAMTFQEPENDPDHFGYLWAVQSTQDSQGDKLSFHLLQLGFRDKKCLPSGHSLYEGLYICEECYTLDLTEGIIPVTGQTNITFLGCQSIEKFPSLGDREEGLNEALSPETSVSIFTWQVSTSGQEKPSVYLGIFDFNSWYSAQFPDSLESDEYLHDCSYFALWSLDSVVNRFFPSDILHILVHERSLNRAIPPSHPPLEFFHARCLNFEATCLMNSGVVHINCTSPRTKEFFPRVSTLPIPDASVGTLILQVAQKISKHLNTGDCPVCLPSQCTTVSLQSPTKSPLDLPSHLLPIKSCVKRSWEHMTNAKELHCFETPLDAKKAKTLPTTVAASGFAKPSPQSILKSCLPATLASSSLSPGPSLVPVQRTKSTISLREEGMTAKCTTGVAYDTKTNIYASTPPHSNLGKTESLKTQKKVSFSLDNQELHGKLQDTSSHCLEKSDMSKGNNSASTTILEQTSKEDHDAVSPKAFKGMFTPLKTVSSSTELIADVTEKGQDGNINMVQSEVQKVSGTVAREDSKSESSLTTPQADVSMSGTARKRGRPNDVTPTDHEEERSPKRRKELRIPRRSPRNTSATTKNTHAGKQAPEQSVSVPKEELETELSPN